MSPSVVNPARPTSGSEADGKGLKPSKPLPPSTMRLRPRSVVVGRLKFAAVSPHWHKKRINIGTYSLLQRKVLTEIWGSNLWGGGVTKKAHNECCYLCNLGATCIRNNLQRQGVRSNLNTLVDKYQHREIVVIK